MLARLNIEKSKPTRYPKNDVHKIPFPTISFISSFFIYKLYQGRLDKFSFSTIVHSYLLFKKGLTKIKKMSPRIIVEFNFPNHFASRSRKESSTHYQQIVIYIYVQRDEVSISLYSVGTPYKLVRGRLHSWSFSFWSEYIQKRLL